MASDFDKWMAYHGGAYPAFLTWVNDAANIRHVDHMRRLLGPYTFDQLKDATDTLFASETQPRGFGSHARAIRQHIATDAHTATRDGPELKDGELVMECTRCSDYGTVEVVSPQCLRLLWKEKDRPKDKRVSTCMIACDCKRGGYKARRLKVPQWANGHALFAYEDIINEAVGCALNFEQLLDAEWSVARRMLYEHHDKYNTPQELSAEALP